MTPAEELAQAADKLDALISRVPAGPWFTEDVGTGDQADVLTYEVLPSSRTAWAAVIVDAPRRPAAYIAAMNPLVGKALANWLREHARRAVEHYGWDAEAVVLARLINGDES